MAPRACPGKGALRLIGTREITIIRDTLLAFLVTSFVIELTPGPNMTYLAVLSASHGRRAGFAATLGVGLGLLIVGAGAALGLAAVISNSRPLYEVLRWAGVLYLLWLAWEGWRDAAETSPGRATVVDGRGFFWRGVVTNLLNPKAAVFYVAVLPTFVEPSKPVLAQTVLLSVVYVGVATLIHLLIVGLAGAAGGFVSSRSGFGLRRGLSLALAAIAIWFAFATRH